MKRLLKKLEATMAAVAFAEQGEAETARQIVAEADRDEPAARKGRQPALRPGYRGTPLAKGSGA